MEPIVMINTMGNLQVHWLIFFSIDAFVIIIEAIKPFAVLKKSRTTPIIGGLHNGRKQNNKTGQTCNYMHFNQIKKMKSFR